MATIEQRAKEYLCGDTDSHPVRLAMYEAYVDGATEQHRIEISKLKEVLDTLMLNTHDKCKIIELMEKQL